MRLINNYTAEKHGTTPAQLISETFDFLKVEDKVLVCVIDNKKAEGAGYLLGVAKRFESGYTATNYILATLNYEEANKWVKEANTKIWGRTAKEDAIIQLSSMRIIS